MPPKISSVIVKSNHKSSGRSLNVILFLGCTAAIFYYSWLPSSNLRTESYLPQIIIDWTSEYLNLRTAVPFLALGYLCEVLQDVTDYKAIKYFFVRPQTVIICAVIVCLAEAGQFFISDRHPDFMDIFFGIAGGICGGTAALSFKKLNHYFLNKNA
ncbi:Predicted integral membrane protein [Flavobacterium hibernum]|uniref:VanZ-like domain-containing protein n=1 Tax=Flavobacterium hibernum TaxID=37752 RepID=A0ABX4BYR8_9FLAO|nr:hypothetical protein B0A73_18660 [Flavobacterium hibernum]STO10335.1 Predicted integral membrane protein [Flavobacterium hibernum]